MVEHGRTMAVVLDAAPLSPMQYPALQKALAKILCSSFCHCCYVALKLCTSTFFITRSSKGALLESTPMQVMLHTDVSRRTFFLSLFTGIHWSEYRAIKVQFINFIIREQYKRGKKSINRFSSIYWLVIAVLSLQNKALLDLLLCIEPLK